jgi:N-acetylmuramoyl-L-alanine amidase
MREYQASRMLDRRHRERKYRAMLCAQFQFNPFFLRTRFGTAIILLALAILSGAGCRSVSMRPGAAEPRRGDEIVVAGKFVHTGTPVVLWMDPGGYDAYRVERRFSAFEKSDWDHSRAEVRLFAPNRYGLRARGLTDEEIERVRGGGWDLPLLQKKVDQFVIHFDVAGVSRQCFKTLQDARGLSVHFMLDIDGTVYQTLDLKERASHATKANDRSVGIEIANMGSYNKKEKLPFDDWYKHDTNGQTIITIPKALGDGGVRTKGFVGHPARPDIIKGQIQEIDLVQYDFTPQQYAALVKLTATLCTVFPKIQCRYPTDASGKLIPHKLDDDDYDKYEGVLGHYHVQSDKVDPGPAFDWDYVLNGARKLMQEK